MYAIRSYYGQDTADFREFDEFVDAGLVVRELGLPGLRAQETVTLSYLERQENQGCGNDDHTRNLSIV